MADPIWGMLAKSQTDSETIEQAIARLILVHEQDEESHLGVGESLQSHKASAIIDHLAASIVQDKLKDREVTQPKMADFKGIRHSLAIESIDLWTTSGTVTPYVGEVNLQTSGANNAVAYAFPKADAEPLYTKRITAQFVFRFAFNTYQIGYITIGNADPAEITYDAVGLKIVNGTVYAMHTKVSGGVKTEYLDEIAGVDILTIRVFRIEYYPAVKIEFYIDDVLKITQTTNFPVLAGADKATIAFLYIKATQAQVKAMGVRQIYFSQDV